MYEIYDIVTKRSIKVAKWPDLSKEIEGLKIKEYSGFSRIFSGKRLHVDCRYIHLRNKSKIFTLVNFETSEEYDCVTDSSLEHYFNQKLTKNEVKYVYELRKGRQQLASICGKLLFKKGIVESPRFGKGFVKNRTPKLDQRAAEQKLKAKIKLNLSCRIRDSIKRQKTTKGNFTRQLVGCSVDFLMGYLESKFSKGMSWRNWGKRGWHIDHIKPCISFDLTDPEQQMACFHYTNMQPLWATTQIALENGEMEYVGNINKGDKILNPLRSV